MNYQNSEIESLVIVIDNSGIKVANRGEWIRHKWKVRKGWIKVHVTVDVETREMVSMKITDESIGDEKMLKLLLEESEKNRKKAD